MNQIKRFTVAVMVACVAACASSATEQHEYDDPFEGYNRAMFSFNYQVDKYVIKPVAEGYRAVTTPFIRERISSVIDNLKEPVSAGNYLLQADPEASVKSLSRFVINSTLGLVGMFDVAEGWGLPKDKTTFNETFAKWCIPQGPFIVLPLLGPSTPRAATGMALDFVFDPVYWATYQDANVHDKASWGYAIAQGITVREAALDILDDLERNSVDFYATMRSAYLQNQSKLKCFNDVSKDENTYDFDFGIEDEDAAFDEMEAE
ncbi:MAG: VacJ family lipoprotein [Alphaproteobacteria bacterium]|nr:VacJ family lipoprotein [Alphaproteobacteria bacterium]